MPFGDAEAGFPPRSVRLRDRRADRPEPPALLRLGRAHRHAGVLHRQHRQAAVLRRRRKAPSRAAASPTCYFLKGDLQLTPRAARVLPLLPPGLDQLLPAAAAARTSQLRHRRQRARLHLLRAATPGRSSNSIVNELAALYAESNQTTDPRRATRRRHSRSVGSAALRLPELQLGSAVRARSSSTSTTSSAMRCRSARATTSGRSAAASRCCRRTWSTRATRSARGRSAPISTSIPAIRRSASTA